MQASVINVFMPRQATKFSKRTIFSSVLKDNNRVPMRKCVTKKLTSVRHWLQRKGRKINKIIPNFGVCILRIVTPKVKKITLAT